MFQPKGEKREKDQGKIQRSHQSLTGHKNRKEDEDYEEGARVTKEGKKNVGRLQVH